jgi:hypothetical protein
MRRKYSPRSIKGELRFFLVRKKVSILNPQSVSLDKRKETRKDWRQSPMPTKKPKDSEEKLQLSRQWSRRKSE